MTKFSTLTGAGAILLLTAATAFAAPCATGTTTNSQGQNASKDKSSNVDGGSTAKVSPGAKAESPGTVGALDNVGANTKPGDGEKKPEPGKVVQGQNSNDC